jgi:NAD(P)-dependent dehydrogenase (short-subunit alcohol dehydrogenase family)
MRPVKGYKDKVAVITGAGRGIGRGIALHCAKEGMKVVLAGIGMESLTNTAADLDALGVESLIVQTDVSRVEEVENLAEATYEAFGQVDLLVNNAGVAAPGPVLGNTLDDWNWVMGVNFYGVLYGVKIFVPRMIAQETTSHVVNVSSLSGLAPGGGSYGVSKHAVVVLTESLHYDLAGSADHVKVSVYCPGWVATEFHRVDQSRPDRFKGDASEVTEERRANWQAMLEAGFSIEESAQILFEGLAQDKLYIGPQTFMEQLPDLGKWIRGRAENIVEEKTPGV